MEETFSRSIKDLSKMRSFGDEEMHILEEADSAAEELVMPEYEHYMNHEFDAEAISIAKNTGFLEFRYR